ncbi:hypothetical protein CDL15_Pgr028202 [Punica granatum]|uniref:Uncharacterized protein n=1 Tax=Punica granatum TaxID=22663 RepID=A0A218WVR6_PUNGR|nr:hypothetical protein CDL15_Pgr028202 [Punica granatum]
MGQQNRQGFKRNDRGDSANLRFWKNRQGFKRNDRGDSANLRFWKVSSHGLAEPARLSKSKLARVSRSGKVARGTSEVARRTCGAGK